MTNRTRHAASRTAPSMLDFRLMLVIAVLLAGVLALTGQTPTLHAKPRAVSAQPASVRLAVPQPARPVPTTVAPTPTTTAPQPVAPSAASAPAPSPTTTPPSSPGYVHEPAAIPVVVTHQSCIVEVEINGPMDYGTFAEDCPTAYAYAATRPDTLVTPETVSGVTDQATLNGPNQ